MFVSRKKVFIALMLGLALLASVPAAQSAQSAQSGQSSPSMKSTPKVTLASVGWTGVSIKTQLAMAVLESLGYEAENYMVSVPIAFKALSLGDADVFLGTWMPTMKSMADPYFADGSVIKYVANMPGAKYTLAVPTYCAKAGLRDFKDIATYGDKLDWKIYGIEAGNDGNEVIQNMIDADMYGLGKFELVPSSEAAMLAQVQAYAKEGKWIVFLGWAPHSMNERIDMTYLTGSTAETFGENDGTATVWTSIRKGFPEDDPNAALLFKNMTFPVAMMNQIMTTLHKDDSLTPREAGLAWVKAHPESYRAWLEGVTTVDGRPGVQAFEASLASVQ